MITELNESTVVENALVFSRHRKYFEDGFSNNKFTFETNGHYFSDKILEVIKYECEFKCLIADLGDLHSKELDDLIEHNVIPYEHGIRIGSVRDCNWCGEPIVYRFDGKSFKFLSLKDNDFVAIQCAYSGGIKQASIELNVPSGKIVFANDLRRWFRIIGSHNINSNHGTFKEIKAAEKIGMAYGFVGNTNPDIYQVNEQLLSISDEPSTEYWDDKTQTCKARPKKQIKLEAPKGKCIGGICTDLWWYCAVDYDDFKERFSEKDPKENFNEYIEDSCTVAKVKPGAYTFVHYFKEHDSFGEDLNSPNHYAIIKWSGEAKENNYYTKFKKENRTIGQCFLATVQEYPSLHGIGSALDKKKHSINKLLEMFNSDPELLEKAAQRFYDHIFWTIGNGVKWHPNGWAMDVEVPGNSPDIKLPKLTKAYRWYPGSEDYSDICLAASGKEDIRGEIVNLNETFLMSAVDMLESMVKFGVLSFNDKGEHKLPMILVKKTLKQLKEKYNLQ